MASFEYAERMCRIRKNVLEMLSDRGYVVQESDVLGYEQFKQKFGDSFTRDELSIKACKAKNPEDQIFVFFPDDVKIGVTHIKKYIDRMKSENATRAILVVQQNLTPMAKKSIQEVTYHMEVFQEAELLVNINKHSLVPEHQVLTNEAKKELLERYALKETQLPRILHSDPIAKYHGLQRGQVVKIIRESETAGRYVTYRYCI
ncbi:DNA-directed RNA polymerases II and IV subunit 5A [Iris pallida]|uniref:DNA-directed RNA polymerases II and IV subunit 5A n=1 Tax=Iris pallida TaxID=29817 RepID=A0AAX6DMT8_IRIPA|nr:DNA-directed RNA polymerases II and IV subunit 5A [Iris pallida]KAJ6801861.1 DNA-directed RNA polymerases II and IV subunit 5A [Iris pallida]